MTSSFSRAGAMAALFLVAACGGDGGPGPQTPAPPPAPPPAAAFPQTASATFDTIATSQTYQTNTFFGNAVSGSAAIQGRGTTVTVGYDAATGTYSVQDAAAGASFSAADRATPSGYVDVYAKQAGAVTDQLKAFGNVRAGGPQSGAPVQLSYLSYGIWSHSDQPGQTRRTWVLFGFPTTAAAMPRTGSATYQAAVTGQILDIGAGTGPVELGGTASLVADFAASTVKTDLNLVRTFDQGAVGAFSGTGAISGDQFSGTFASSARFFTGGAFNGGFYGPTAQEMGYAFSIKFHNPDPFAGASIAPSDTILSGVAVGSKK